MKTEVYACDGCGKQKGESNHWYATTIHREFAALVIVTFAESQKRMVAAEDSAWEHFCGEECLLKMVARNLPK